MNKAIFIDRDGVLNSLVWRDNQLKSPKGLNELFINKELKLSLSVLKSMGYLLVVVTNQPCIARKEFSLNDVDSIHKEIKKYLPIEYFYVCPHTDQDNCICRKPKPGLINQAAHDLSIDISNSFLVGDRMKDIHAANSAGSKSILIGSYDFSSEEVKPDYKAIDSSEAFSIIIGKYLAIKILKELN